MISKQNRVIIPKTGIEQLYRTKQKALPKLRLQKSLSIIIAFQSTLDRNRFENLRCIIKYYSSLIDLLLVPANIIVAGSLSYEEADSITSLYPLRIVEHPLMKQFNRSKLLNLGACASDSDYLFFLDGDVILGLREINNALLKLIQGPNLSAVNPYDVLHDLPYPTTLNLRACIMSDAILHLSTDAYQGEERPGICFAGGALMLTRHAYHTIGGWDENFIGWGGEDDAVSRKLTMLCTTYSLRGVGLHLYHDRPPIVRSKERYLFYLKNIDRLNYLLSLDKKQLLHEVAIHDFSR